MTSAAVNNSVFTPTVAAMPAGKTSKQTDINQNFGDVFTSAGKSLQQQNAAQTQVQTGSAKKADNADKAKAPVDTAADTQAVKTETKNDTAQTADVSAQDTATEETITDEAVIEEVKEAVKQLLEELKKILGISDEELLAAMENIGIQPFDLLNPDVMSQLLAAVTGEDAISLVADENMYTTLQEMVETVNTAVAAIMEDTGLTQEEFDAVLQQLYEVDADITVDDMPVKDFADDTQNALPQEEVIDDTVEEGPVVTVEDKRIITPNKEADVQTQTTAEQNDGDVLVEVKKPSETKHENHDAKNFDSQQGNMAQDSQNSQTTSVDAAAAKAVPESYISETTQDIIRQIADSVRIVKTEQLTEMELQLHPASLGTVNVSLTTKGGVVTAEFITQNEAVRNAIEAQAVQLRENLEEQGVKIEAIEVSVASHQMERNLDDNGQEQRSAEEQETNRAQGAHRKSINFNSYEDDAELIGEMGGADDATRIAMEMMSMNGSSMDLLA